MDEDEIKIVEALNREGKRNALLESRVYVLETAIKDVLAGRCDNWPDHLREALGPLKS